MLRSIDSRMMANASCITSAACSFPETSPTAQFLRAITQLVVAHQLNLRLQLVDLIDDAVITLEQSLVAAAEYFGENF